MKTRLLFGIVCIWQLAQNAGCSPTLKWARAGSPDSEMQMMLGRCSLEAEQTVPLWEEADRTAHVSKRTKLCMQSQGYTQREVEEQ